MEPGKRKHSIDESNSGLQPGPKRAKNTHPDSELFCSEEQWEELINHRGSMPDYEYDSVKLEASPRGTLANEPHSLLHERNFPLDTTCGKLAMWMRPAFQLATKLVTHKAVAKAWIHLTLGVETEDADSAKTYLESTHSEAAEAAHEDFLEFLTNLEVKFLFVAFTVSEGKGQTHAMHLLPGEPGEGQFCVPRGTDLDTLEKMKASHRIAINAVYLEYFMEHPDDRNPTRDLLTYFSLAVTLVHELFHAVYAEGRELVWQGQDYDEPYFDLRQAHNALEPELGFAIELTCFGDLIHTSMHPTQGTNAEVYYKPVARSRKVFASAKTHWYSPVNIGWLYSLMTEERWRNLKDLKSLHVPVPGPILAAKQDPSGEWEWVHPSDTDIKKKLGVLGQRGRNAAKKGLNMKLKEAKSHGDSTVGPRRDSKYWIYKPV